MATTNVLLATGEALAVTGALEDVAKALENATRSSAGTLAWLDEEPGGERVGVNPAQVVSVRRGNG
ncbi:MAG TPA: hypothetical protein VGO83_06910 [Thermoleophilaceae bacterium]|nr:hypothetical protein [Thermoleophilaceae bacterium]